MADLKEMAGAPKVIEVDGKVWNLSPLTLKDMAEIEKWLEDRPFEKLARRLDKYGHRMPDVAIAKISEKAAEFSNRVGFTTPEGMAELKTIEGTQKFLFFSLRHMHKNITEESLNDIINPANLEKFQDALDSVSGLGEEAPGNSRRVKGEKRTGAKSTKPSRKRMGGRRSK